MKTSRSRSMKRRLKTGEQKALLLNTSVNSVVTDYLQQWAAEAAAVEAARRDMKARFAQADRRFAVGTPDDREQRNARR